MSAAVAAFDGYVSIQEAPNATRGTAADSFVELAAVVGAGVSFSDHVSFKP